MRSASSQSASSSWFEGRAVQRAAGALDELEVLVRRDVLGALEEHVLEEVREARASLALVRRADVIPEIDGHGLAPGCA